MTQYKFAAIDRMSKKIVAKSNDYRALCKKYASGRYTIKIWSEYEQRYQ